MKLLQSDDELFGDDEPHEDDLVLRKVRPGFGLHEKTPKAIEVKYMSIRLVRKRLCLEIPRPPSWNNIGSDPLE